MVVEWRRAPNGDSLSAEDGWLPCPAEWADEAEALFQVYSLTEDDDSRRSEISCGREKGSDKLHSVDWKFMTCLQPAAPGGRDRVVPLRRYENGRQTHPPPTELHPWYVRRSKGRDSVSDWLNNDFFFIAFSKVMEDAGHRVSAPAHEIFDFRWNQDYRNEQPTEPAVRGGVTYNLPVGWKKFALRVMGRFEGGNSWLSLNGRAGEWAVAYHGTHVDAMPSILSGGLKAGERQAYKDFVDKRTGSKIGMGIYCTPNFDTAAEFSPAFSQEGRTMQFLFQCRVRPEAIKRIHDEVGRESGAYWLINDSDDIRPYGVLVREVKS